MNNPFIGLFRSLWLTGLFLLFTYTKGSAAPQSVWLECPPNVTVWCSEDLSDLDRWGKAWVWENYKKVYAPAPKSVKYNTNSCGIGTIVRTWEYEDKHWNTHTCTQIITVASGSAGFGVTDINWPPSLELEGCNPSADPRLLPKPYDYPTFKKVGCSQPMYSYKDMKFTVADGCMKILRDWKVIDWCTYVPNANPPVGIWTYTQVIKIVAKDTGAYINCLKDTIVAATNDCKGAFVKLDSVKAFSKCGAISKITNTSPYSIQKGPDASGVYPVGTTEFYYIAEYGCGSVVKCKMKVTVTNNIAPTPYCLTGLIVALMPVDSNRDGVPEDGMIEVWAKDLNLGSFHKCGYKNLRYSFSSDPKNTSRVFTCADLGKNQVEIWVTDTFGNQSFCKTTIEIQNNNAKIPNCKRDSLTGGGTSSLILSGKILTSNLVPLEAVNVAADQMNSFSLQSSKIMHVQTRYDTIRTQSGNIFYVRHSDTTYTTQIDTIWTVNSVSDKSTKEGNFTLKDLKKGNDYRILLDKKQDNINGLDINDVVVLIRHILNSEIIKSPLTLIAADVNSDSKIDYSDFDLLYDVVQGNLPVTAIPVHWKFIPSNFDFSKPGVNPLLALEMHALNHSASDLNYTAIRIGDLDNSFNYKNPTTSSVLGARTRSLNAKEYFDFIQAQMGGSQFAHSTSTFQVHNYYPNPIKKGEKLIIELNNLGSDHSVDVELLDLSGKVLFQKLADPIKIGKTQIEVELPAHLNTGIYYFQLRSSSQLERGKVVLE
ncbi:MAG: T9SS type A sorting domain-containing protein [Saprospiraceae bacterium]|nr:T9SS type A sorting domain-containing protein [Saprospiraceae bacterium]